MVTGVVSSDIYQQHRTGPHHPESPERIKYINTIVEELSVNHAIKVYKPNKISMDIISAVHSRSYISAFQAAVEAQSDWFATMDNPISSRSYEVAVSAVSGTIRAVDLVMNGDVDNTMALVRPPGHHAETNRAIGFCFFNNVAAAARYTQTQYKLNRIAIIDFDVHHGNGTQHIFQSDPSVYYFSIHQFPFYPGTGEEKEQGTNDGLGYTKNYPLPAGTDEKVYFDILENDLADKLLSYRPEMIILSAGFDAHVYDPIGDMRVTSAGFGQITKIISDLAQSTCAGRIVSVLEGGYSLQGLAESVREHLLTLATM
ncbi:MAG: histone deacetylase [Fidelibacterota bacterium]